MTLLEFVLHHTQRGECSCGRCVDRGARPDPSGHTVDTGFFKVSAVNDPDKDEFVRLVKAHPGDFRALDPFDHNVYSFIDVGAWIGDQGVAMQCMALGQILGVWNLLAAPGKGCVIVCL